jgi:hypothetical protein
MLITLQTIIVNLATKSNGIEINGRIKMSVFKLSDDEIIKIVNGIDDDSGVLIKESTLRQLIETYVNSTITNMFLFAYLNRTHFVQI